MGQIRIRVTDPVIEIEESCSEYMFLLPLPESIAAGCRHMPAGIENNQIIVFQVLSEPGYTYQRIG
jgi:hypothetical protein